ncbi:putative Peripheral-type benzodiazepine receptor [Zostera marina]|uniref:Putative Peripheral-type benzodiazepine receptor n=1 Tax=Zostera marina TaxID=29655 RepID=A0A0K9Q5U6_ZOSMR|nr:putative Peripheral-type benzodiazepine receptor [Zostera marina]
MTSEVLFRERTRNEAIIKSMPQKRKNGKATRGLRSLTIAVVIPLCLTTVSMYLCGSATAYYAILKATNTLMWLPPRWLFHTATFSTTTFMCLATWLVWAEGGFRQYPIALIFCLGQLLLGLVWPPLVFRFGATKVSMGVCSSLFLTLFGCFQIFSKINPIAADLVKPYIAWVSFLAIFNYKIM